MSTQEAKNKVAAEEDDVDAQHNKDLLKNDEESRDSTIQSGASVDDEEDDDLQDEEEDNEDEAEQNEEESRHAEENGGHAEVELNGNSKVKVRSSIVPT